MAIVEHLLDEQGRLVDQPKERRPQQPGYQVGNSSARFRNVTSGMGGETTLASTTTKAHLGCELHI